MSKTWYKSSYKIGNKNPFKFSQFLHLLIGLKLQSKLLSKFRRYFFAPLKKKSLLKYSSTDPFQMHDFKTLPQRMGEGIWPRPHFKNVYVFSRIYQLKLSGPLGPTFNNACPSNTSSNYHINYTLLTLALSLSGQWFLTFFAPWTPKSKKKRCKWVQHFTFLIFTEPLDPLHGPLRGPWTPG